MSSETHAGLDEGDVIDGQRQRRFVWSDCDDSDHVDHTADEHEANEQQAAEVPF